MTDYTRRGRPALGAMADRRRLIRRHVSECWLHTVADLDVPDSQTAHAVDEVVENADTRTQLSERIANPLKCIGMNLIVSFFLHVNKV